MLIINSKSTEKGVNSQPKLAPDSEHKAKAVEPMTVAKSHYAVVDRSSPVRTAPPPPHAAAAVTPPTPTPTPDPISTMEIEVEVHANKTMETEPMTSVNELITTTDAMSIDSSLPANVTQSTAEMVSMTTAAPTVNNDDDNDAATKTRELAYITHVDNPNRFYIQLNSDTAAIDSLHESLQIVAPQLPALSEFRAGELCIGKFSLDDCWYRAKIIDTDGKITSIQFIDFGNTDSITDNALLKAPDHTLMAREPFAMACSLPIAQHGNTKKEWAENVCEKLRMLVNDTQIEFELISNYKDVNYIKVFLAGGRDLVCEMIQEEVADQLEIIESGETCYISHINSLNDFYIQVESDTDVLHKVELHLKQNRDASILTAPTIGQICSAQFEDGQFYRARILDILPDTKHYQVEFLDYGNHFLTPEIRSLNPKIGELPYLRKRCQLQLPNEVHDWSEKAEEEFRIISNEGATAFTVHLMKPGKTACVELCMENGVHLSSLLGELCEKRPASPIHINDDPDITPIDYTSHAVSQDSVAVAMLSDILEEASHE